MKISPSGPYLGMSINPLCARNQHRLGINGIRRSPVNSTHKGQWCGVLMLFLNEAWINRWVNNRGAGDLRRHRTHYDVIVMESTECHWSVLFIRAVGGGGGGGGGVQRVLTITECSPCNCTNDSRCIGFAKHASLLMGFKHCEYMGCWHPKTIFRTLCCFFAVNLRNILYLVMDDERWY